VSNVVFVLKILGTGAGVEIRYELRLRLLSIYHRLESFRKKSWLLKKFLKTVRILILRYLIKVSGAEAAIRIFGR
jgi:hypothetical protein